MINGLKLKPGPFRYDTDPEIPANELKTAEASSLSSRLKNRRDEGCCCGWTVQLTELAAAEAASRSRP